MAERDIPLMILQKMHEAILEDMEVDLISRW
jgi:hypothetical protein